jgi:hypothetical protein
MPALKNAILMPVIEKIKNQRSLPGDGEIKFAKSIIGKNINKEAIPGVLLKNNTSLASARKSTIFP